jgi:tetratricopeptide (TPR) repeat protein
MKIAVYTIALNEEKHIERWAQSAKDADVLLVADTGSSDKTIEIAKDNGCQVESVFIQPWRFDDARNVSLALLPHDITYCIALDADEVLVDGWREHLERIPTHVTRPRYKYTWSWNADGSPGVVYSGDKIHKRFGYRWTHPVHEVITPTAEEIQQFCGLEIHHYPDNKKPRSYMSLLELAVKERPMDDRNSHYLAREYYFAGMTDQAIAEFKRHINLETAQWPAEKARSMRYLAQCVPHEAEMWLYRAIAEDPNRRENWFDLALLYYRREDWNGCLSAALKALSIKERALDYMSEPEAWGFMLYDLAALSYYYTGNKEKAVEYGLLAIESAPEDQRLLNNLTFYQS